MCVGKYAYKVLYSEYRLSNKHAPIRVHWRHHLKPLNINFIAHSDSRLHTVEHTFIDEMKIQWCNTLQCIASSSIHRSEEIRPFLCVEYSWRHRQCDSYGQSPFPLEDSAPNRGAEGMSVSIKCKMLLIFEKHCSVHCWSCCISFLFQWVMWTCMSAEGLLNQEGGTVSWSSS